MKKAIMITLVLTLCLFLNGCADDSKITMDEFNQIKDGMTYEEVCDIIGGEGELVTSTDIGLGSEYKTEMYTWEGNGSMGANANVTIQGGKVVGKAQLGLK